MTQCANCTRETDTLSMGGTGTYRVRFCSPACEYEYLKSEFELSKCRLNSVAKAKQEEKEMTNITEKLSTRLQRLFLTHVKKYDRRYFSETKMIDCLQPQTWDSVPPIRFANEMVETVMRMIEEAEGKIE